MYPKSEFLILILIMLLLVSCAGCVKTNNLKSSSNEDMIISYDPLENIEYLNSQEVNNQIKNAKLGNFFYRTGFHIDIKDNSTKLKPIDAVLFDMNGTYFPSIQSMYVSSWVLKNGTREVNNFLTFWFEVPQGTKIKQIDFRYAIIDNTTGKEIKKGNIIVP